MERSLINDGIVLPSPELAPRLPWRLTRFVPLWRHAAWMGALFFVCAAAAAVRLDVQQLRKDLDRNTRMEREASVLNERLRLEMDARRRVVAVQGIADGLSLDAQARIVRLAEPR